MEVVVLLQFLFHFMSIAIESKSECINKEIMNTKIQWNTLVSYYGVKKVN